MVGTVLEFLLMHLTDGLISYTFNVYVQPLLWVMYPSWEPSWRGTLHDICAAAGWSSHTFIWIYTLDWTPPRDHTSYRASWCFTTLRHRHLPVCGGIGIDVPIALGHNVASSSLKRELHQVMHATWFLENGMRRWVTCHTTSIHVRFIQTSRSWIDVT